MTDFATALESFERKQTELAADKDRFRTGRVVSFSSNYLFVDIGFITEGVVPMDEVKDHDGNIRFRCGDAIDVMVEKGRTEEGYFNLSFQKAQRLHACGEVTKAHLSKIKISAAQSTAHQNNLAAKATDRTATGNSPEITADLQADLSRSIRLKTLPNSNLPLRLATEFGWQVNPLSQLARQLTEDQQRSFVLHDTKGNRENFVVSTPRLRVRFFPDAYDESSVVILSVEANSPERWRADKRFALPCRFEWVSESVVRCAPRQRLLDTVRAFTDGKADSESFWEFWSEYLNKEKEDAKSKREHPGWSYSQRRYGLDGCIDFFVGDNQSEILTNSSGRLLVESGGKDPNGRVPYIRLEVRKPLGQQWIAALPLQQCRIDQIPTAGAMKVDWISVESERKRREDALHKLRLGRTAMPNLNVLLPEGKDVQGGSASFTPLLDKTYNEEQNGAIAKALVENTVTVILGPPGTGKTSVIAEIASQLASRGKRVLISSQSNLAVDNALEKVLDSDQIFRIRIGRPESVKFNSELLRDRASDRYRRKLLEKSTRAFNEMKAEVDSKVHISCEDVHAVCARSHAYVEVSDTHKKVSNERDRARALSEHGQTCLQTAVAEKNEILRAEGLTDADLPAFVKSLSALARSSIEPLMVAERYEAINSAPSRREDLQLVRECIAEEKSCEEKASTAGKCVRDLENRISTSAGMEIELARRAGHNISVELKRQNSGFWATLGSYLTDSKYDLEPIQKEIRNLAAGQAQSQLPSARNEQRTAEDFLLRARKAREQASRFLGSSEYGLRETEEKANALASDLAIADVLIASGGITYAKNMRSSASIVMAIKACKRAFDEAQAAEEQVGIIQKELDKVIHNLSDLRPSISELEDYCRELGVEVTLPISPDHRGLILNAAGRCRVACFRLETRREKSAQLSSALAAYHSRLSEESVDLSKAAIAEANVVGATCSGIAGSSDFADDFDLVIVDEAGRATPLDLLMPMVRGRSIVLVGDHKQLPPLLNQEIEKELLNDSEIDGSPDDYRLTLFERLFRGVPDSRKEALRKQYRMVNTICDVVRELSYRELAIETTGDALTRAHPFPNIAPIHWVKCEGSKNVAETVGYGIRNAAEVAGILQFIRRLVPMVESDGFLQFLKEKKQGNPYEIGVIAMYRQQALALESAISREKFISDRLKIEVGTVDAFQGREKDAVFVSFVETNPNKLRFFYDRKRLNVALSRARELLVIVGSLDVLGRRPKVQAAGNAVPNPLHELKFLFEACAGAGVATREVHRAE